ncbi:MAG: substrate-binding domain-containing protein [Gemmataceae bacterium]
MRSLRILGLLVFTLTVLAHLPGCRSKSGRIKVAFISNNEHEFWQIAKRGTEAAGKEADVDVEFKMPSGGGSAEQQRRFIEDLLSKGCKGIAISPNDAGNQVDFFKEINTQVPLLAVDSDVPDPSARRCYLGTNNVEAGKAAGELVKKALPSGGKIMIYVGKLDVRNAIERREGVVTALAGGKAKCEEQIKQMEKGDYPVQFGDYKLMGTMTDDGKSEVCRTKVDDTLTKYPDVKCLVGLWAYNPPAMLEGVKAAKKLGQVQMVGFDENEETLQAVQDGYIVGTIVQDPYHFGYEAVKILAGLAKSDNSVLDRKDMEANHCIYVKHRTITKDNVKDFWGDLKKLKGQ